MSLSSSLMAHKSVKRGPKCTVCLLLVDLPKADAEALKSALADPTFTTVGISRALKSEGHDIRPTTVGRHRNGECKGNESVRSS